MAFTLYFDFLVGVVPLGNDFHIPHYSYLVVTSHLCDIRSHPTDYIQNVKSDEGRLYSLVFEQNKKDIIDFPAG